MTSASFKSSRATSCAIFDSFANRGVEICFDFFVVGEMVIMAMTILDNDVFLLTFRRCFLIISDRRCVGQAKAVDGRRNRRICSRTWGG